KNVLVLSPHPDDEAIGCGGTLCQHVAAGDRVHVIFLTSGENGGHGVSPAKTRRVREEEARKAAARMGLDAVEFWHQPDGALRVTSELAQALGKRMTEWRPSVVYVPHPQETHSDHRAAARLV